MSKILHKYISILLPIYITTILWLAAKVFGDNPISFSINNINRYISQIISLWAIVLFAISYLIATRLKVIEKLYGGLDKSYKTHGFIGKLGFVFALFHPILLSLQYISNLEKFKTFYLIGEFNSIAKNFGVLALYLYLILILFAIFRFLPYQVWKNIHKLMGIPFIFAAIHMVLALSDVRDFPPLKVWMISVAFIGGLSYIYKLVFYKFAAPHYLYNVFKVNKLNNDITEIYLKPMHEKLNFEPGEFVYFRVLNNPLIKKEEHPFSISSDPHKDTLRISYKTFGDYTKSLDNLRVNDIIDLHGSYGEFTSYMYNKHKNQVWIAGGIGVTPFLSMLSYECKNEDKKNIYFVYANDKQIDSVYDNEIKNSIKTSDDNIIYDNYLTEGNKFLTAEYLKSKTNLADSIILICGPKVMLTNLRKQLMNLGVKSENIIYEDFSII